MDAYEILDVIQGDNLLTNDSDPVPINCLYITN